MKMKEFFKPRKINIVDIFILLFAVGVSILALRVLEQQIPLTIDHWLDEHVKYEHPKK